MKDMVLKLRGLPTLQESQDEALQAHLLHEAARPVTGFASVLDGSLPGRLPVAAAARSGGSGLVCVAGVDRGLVPSVDGVCWGVLSTAGARSGAVACGCCFLPLCCVLGWRSL